MYCCSCSCDKLSMLILAAAKCAVLIARARSSGSKRMCCRCLAVLLLCRGIAAGAAAACTAATNLQSTVVAAGVQLQEHAQQSRWDGWLWQGMLAGVSEGACSCWWSNTSTASSEKPE
jgi:hypothetical protein